MPHIVLLGDSIFDNAVYVPGQPAVIDQLRRELPAGWTATLLAVDGHMTGDVVRQLTKLPGDATHLAISVGGNDALGASGVLRQPARSVSEAMSLLADIQIEFRSTYREMLANVLQRRLPTVVATIYDEIPGLELQAVAALALFNDVILRAAISAGLPVLDLRLVCNKSRDYSTLSAIEPSHLGGAKIAASIARICTGHDFGSRDAVIYGR